MKKLFLSLVAVVVMASTSFAGFQIPNLEAGVGYDFELGKTVSCMSSKVLSIDTTWGELEGRIGYTETNKPILTASYDLRNLEKINIRIHYLLQEYITLGCGMSINMESKKVNVFVHAIMGTIGSKYE